MLYAGLTGGIASGKSVVAGHLARSGCAILDLDRVAHAVMAPSGPAYADVVAEFGREVLAPDATIDRKRLGAQVFGDPARLERLNAIVHPIVRHEEARSVAALEAAGAEVVVSEAALLVETGLHLRFDRLIVADCTPEQQRQRLERRDGMSPGDALARLAAQMPAALKVRFAHTIVDTSASLEDTERRSAELARDLLALARAAPGQAPRRERLLAGLAVAASSTQSLAARFIEDVAQAGVLDLRRIARVFGDSLAPWYEPHPGSGHAPVEIAVPVVIHLLQRPAGNDDELLASALAAVGRALCDDRSDWADACLVGLAMAAAIRGATPSQRDPWPEWIQLAERWTGGRPRPSQMAEWREVGQALALQPPGPLGPLYERFLAVPR